MSARRGDVWLVDLDPVEGREQAGRRPALVLSVDTFNASLAELVTVVPITSKARRIRTRVQVEAPEGGLSVTSFVICEQMRTLSTRRLGRCLGSVHPSTMAKVEQIVRVILGL